MRVRHAVLPATNGTNHTCLCLPNRSWFSFTDPGGIQGWVSLGTTTVSRQSAQDRYVTGITAISCSDHHASPGNCKRSGLRASISLPLGPKAAMLTTTPPSHPIKNPQNAGCPLLIKSSLVPTLVKPHRMEKKQTTAIERSRASVCLSVTRLRATSLNGWTDRRPAWGKDYWRYHGI